MNIVMVVGDTVRADHLGCYGYFRPTSPHIDSLAREGILFEDFYSSGCPTGPGFTSIYTGLHTIHHKYYQFGAPNVRQVDDKVFTLPEVMRAYGYLTAGFDNLINVMYARGKHFVRGYEIYVNCGPDPFDTAHFLTADRLNRRLIPWVKTLLEEPFFLFVHYWDPHMPYNQPSEYRNIFRHEKGNLGDLRVKKAAAGYEYVPGWGKVGQLAEGDLKAIYGPLPTMSVDLYDGEINYMDDAIGELLQALKDKGVWDRTAMVFTADHGEQLYQHGGPGAQGGYGWEHAGLHDAVTHLPLVIRQPDASHAGTRVKGYCQQIDLLPTIAEMAGGDPVALEVDGRSTLGMLQGASLRDRIFMEQLNGQRAIRTDRWKLLDNRIPGAPFPETELFDIQNDPMEMLNLAHESPSVARELLRELDDWIRSCLNPGEKDPAVCEDSQRLKDESREYRAKIARFMESVPKKL